MITLLYQGQGILKWLNKVVNPSSKELVTLTHPVVHNSNSPSWGTAVIQI